MLYNLSIYLYVFVLKVASLFNDKARLWVDGRRDILKRMEDAMRENKQPVAWFHCASLGEFEQGRPLIEKFKATHPEYKVLLTFFSPSGYEIRKNYQGADYVFYLPADTPPNVKRFVRTVKPSIVFFVKYEFWGNYIKKIHKEGVPIYLVSAIFRANQYFFKWYGWYGRKMLRMFKIIFVQDENSERLLAGVNGLQVVCAGDTRFDRVYETAVSAPKNELIDEFCRDSKVLICGSSWLPDEEIVCKIMDDGKHQLKYIIVPHEIDKAHIDKLKQLIGRPVTLYTTAKSGEMSDVLIVDTIGILSQIYRYTDYAYIGGGFGVGIHNILEAATFGKPVFFGPNYGKFKEARDLIAIGAAVSINGWEDLTHQIELLEANGEEYRRRSEDTRNFVEKNIGATRKIIEMI